MYNLYKYLFSFFSMMSLQLGYSQVRQDSFHNEGNIIITKPSIKISKFDSTIKVLKRPLFQNYSSSLLALEVKEVYEPWETCEPFSDDYGHFSYCGDVVGGIKNLLQTHIGSMPHLRFENRPIEKRTVYFYGIGLNVRPQKSKDTIKNLFSDPRYISSIGLSYKNLAFKKNFSSSLKSSAKSSN